MRKAIWLGLFLAIVLVLSIPSAKADILTPGDSGIVPDVLTTNFPFVTVAATTGSFSSPAISGTWAEQVIADPNNYYCVGCFDWFIQIVVNNGPDSVGRVTASDFSGFLTDVGYDPTFCGIYVCTEGSPVTPSTVDRITADVIGFNFAPGIGAGNGSVQLEIETNAMAYTTGYLGLIDGIPTDVQAYAPAVPDGGVTFMLLGGVMVGLETLRRRFRV